MITSSERTSILQRGRDAESYWGALTVIEAFDRVGDLDALSETLCAAFAVYDLDHFIVAGLPNAQERFDDVVLLKHWSADWFELYTAEHFVHDDPVVRMCRSTTMPFEWTQAPFDRDREPRALHLMNLASDFGLASGFSVPVHGINGYEACFSVSGVKPTFGAGAKAALHLIALYAFERVRRFSLDVDMRSPLTPREAEVLTWAALGKTHADIADILCVTERTITAHTINATQKLGATNKTHAVVKAMQAKFIRL